jgi:hypothetical protein
MPATVKSRAVKSASAPSGVKNTKSRLSGRSKSGGGGPDLFVKDQVAKLEGMMAALLDKANRGDLPAVDRILKILDRLDRYRGLTQPVLAAEDDDARERILQKLSDIDLRRANAREAVLAGELPGAIRLGA